jgi:hypothetical protein
MPVLRRSSFTNPRLSNDRLLLDAKKGNTFLGVVWGLMHLSAFWLSGKRHFHVILFSRCSIPKPRFWSIFRFTLGNGLEAVFFYFKENPGRHPGFSKWPESKLLKPAHLELPGKSTHGLRGRERGPDGSQPGDDPREDWGPGGLQLAPACEPCPRVPGSTFAPGRDGSWPSLPW